MSNNNAKDQRAEDWTGTRNIIMLTNVCALCRDTKCERCAREIAWYDRLWICPCECNKNWKPQKVVAEKKQTAPKEAVKSIPETSVST